MHRFLSSSRKLTHVRHVHTRGFTLVETLIAVTLLLLVIVGPMTIASKGMRNAYFAGDQTTATFLAQEAIEHMQSLRDNNALQHVTEYQTEGNNDDGDNVWEWYENAPQGMSNTEWNYCKAASGCDYDFENDDFLNCGTLSTCRLNRYTGSGEVDRVYSYNTGTDWSSSPYTRIITVGDVINDGSGNPMAVPVTVTVRWTASLFSDDKEVVLQTYLYNLYSRFE